MRRDKYGGIILATPNPDCPYCQAKNHHMDMTPEERKKFHPDAGKGVDNFGTKRKEPRNG